MFALPIYSVVFLICLLFSYKSCLYHFQIMMNYLMEDVLLYQYVKIALVSYNNKCDLVCLPQT